MSKINTIAAPFKAAIARAALAVATVAGARVCNAERGNVKEQFDALHWAADNIRTSLNDKVVEARKAVDTAKEAVQAQNAVIKAAQAELRRLYEGQRDAEVALNATEKEVDGLRSLLPSRSDNPEPAKA